jgi:hypothetical protein
MMIKNKASGPGRPDFRFCWEGRRGRIDQPKRQAANQISDGS